MTKSPFLLSISQDMRQKGYSLRTEKTYLHWIKRFIIIRLDIHLSHIDCKLGETKNPTSLLAALNYVVAACEDHVLDA